MAVAAGEAEAVVDSGVAEASVMVVVAAGVTVADGEAATVAAMDRV